MKQDKFGSFKMETIAVLGLEMNLTLRGIGEELKVQTHLDKPCVAKKTILHTVRRQNEVILTCRRRYIYALQKEVGVSK